MDNKATYVADGKAKVFHFDFSFFQRADIQVTINDQAPWIEYGLVIGKPNPTASFPYTGGAVMFSRAPVAGSRIEITRNFVLQRPVDYQEMAQPTPTELNLDGNFFLENIRDLWEKIGGINNALAVINDPQKIDYLIKLIAEVKPKLENLNNLSGMDEQIAQISQQLQTMNGNIGSLNDRIDGIDDDIDGIQTDIANIDLDGDYVVASQMPTSQNQFTWYRKYKSGWVDQGGMATTAKNSDNTPNLITVTMPITMQSTNYTLSLGAHWGWDVTKDLFSVTHGSRTTNSFKVRGVYGNETITAAWQIPVYWRVCGMGA